MGLNRYFIRFFLLLVSLLYLAFFFNAPSVLDYNYLKGILLFNLFVLIIYLFSEESIIVLRRQYIRVFYFFLLGFFVVHFQVYVDVVLGNYEYFGHDYLINESIVCKTALVSSIAFFMFLFGYSSQVNKFKLVEFQRLKELNVKGVVFLILAFFFLFLGSVDTKFFIGGYGAASKGGIELSGISYYSNQFLVFSIIAYFVIIVYNSYVKGLEGISIFKFFRLINKMAFFIICVYCLLMMLAGDRGSVIQIFSVLLVSYVLISKVKISFVKLSFCLVLAASLFSFLAYVREMKNTDSFIDKISQAVEVKNNTNRNNSFLPVTIELGSSVRTLHAAVDYTERNGYTYGIFQGVQVIGIIPGLGLLIQNIFNLDFHSFGSASLLTGEIQGSNITHSLGTSIVADIYLDFGIFGIMIIFCVFGMFVRYLEINVYSRNFVNLFLFCLFFVLFSKAIYINRSTLLVLLRDGLMVYFVVLVSQKIFKYKTSI